MRTVRTMVLLLGLGGTLVLARPGFAEPFLGEVRWVAFHFAPRGWAIADGSLLPISTNTALFSLLGTSYGGDGRTTFALPDLRGRVPIGVGQGPGLTDRVLGESAGEEHVTLTVAQMPAHTHLAGARSEGATARDPGNHVVARTSEIGKAYGPGPPTVTLHSGAIGATGGSQPHNNMPPFLTLTPIIAIEGLFPSRQ